jgi:hypothetical protein
MLFVIPLLLSETDASSRKIIAHCVSSFIHERRSSSAKEHNIHISYILKEEKKIPTAKISHTNPNSPPEKKIHLGRAHTTFFSLSLSFPLS